MVDSESTFVTLREITAETVRVVTRLAVLPEQRGFVATNAESLAQALFSEEAWYRAIYAGDTPAGFVMLYDESLRSSPPPAPQVAVWRFMIDAQFQRQGIGTAAMRAIIAHVRKKGVFDTLELSYVPGPGSPEPFYRRAGFVPTGRVDEGEVVLEMRLARSASDSAAGSGTSTEGNAS
jgi:diamine N-acetyltransferase